MMLDLLCAELRFYDATTSSSDVHCVGSFERNDMFFAEMKHFVACVRGEQTPVISLEEGIRVQRLIADVERSAQDGRFVESSREGSAV